ncbi:toxin-antitoxin system, toxin component [Streptomyces griseoflavus]|uniref:toxin-antitoxin system, toxin component n=1 Tax=Streptomyces griseoflavus TaxID=35619 RepID=UPI0033B0535E
MSRPSRAMRKLSTELVRHLRPPTDHGDLIAGIGRALSLVRGRPVRLREAAFPPATASGVWVDRTDRDLIVYEQNTGPEHQIVIIGHEAWHMFQGHGSPGTDLRPTAARATDSAPAEALTAFVATVSEAARTDLPPDRHRDAALHYAARTDGDGIRQELEAEHFGFRFATDVRAALDEARTAGDPRHLTGRIHASMAHRFGPT